MTSWAGSGKGFKPVVVNAGTGVGLLSWLGVTIHEGYADDGRRNSIGWREHENRGKIGHPANECRTPHGVREEIIVLLVG